MNIIKKTIDQSEDELGVICWDLLTDHPFYGNVLGNITRRMVDSKDQSEATEIKTLTLSTVQLSFNYKLWEPLDRIQKVNRILHELIHLVFLHPWKEKPSNKGLFYTACDLSVNMYCDDSLSLRIQNFDKLLKKYGLKLDTSRGYMSLFDSMVDIMQEIPAGIFKKHAGDKVAFDAEVQMWTDKALSGEFFEPNTRNLTEAIAFVPKQGAGDVNLSGLAGMVENMKAAGATGDEIAQAIQDYMAKPNDPWEAVAQGTAESAAEDLVKRMLEGAKSRGEIPGGLEAQLDILLAPPIIDWRRIIREFTKTAGHVTMSSTMSRRSKRYGTFPASRIRRLQKIAIIIDTSGSMSDREFEQAISEVAGALQSNCQVIVVQADSQVDDVAVYDKKLPNLTRVTRHGMGGTSFDDGLEYVKSGGKLDKHEEFPIIGNVDGVVYITDGYAPAPELEVYPRCKVLWLTTQKPVEQMQEEGFRGKIVFIDCDDM